MPMSSPNHNVPSLIYVTCSLDIVDNYRCMDILIRASYPLQKLPESAVVMYGDYLGEKVVLKVPNGEKWPIGLTSRDRKVWLNKGWSKFAEFYSLDHGNLLIFNFEGDHSHFHVRIFARSCLEKDFGSFFSVEDHLSGETDNVGSSESPLMGSCSKRNGEGPAFPLNAPPSFFKVVLDDTLRDGKIVSYNFASLYSISTYILSA